MWFPCRKSDLGFYFQKSQTTGSPFFGRSNIDGPRLGWSRCIRCPGDSWHFRGHLPVSSAAFSLSGGLSGDEKIRENEKMIKKYWGGFKFWTKIHENPMESAQIQFWSSRNRDPKNWAPNSHGRPPLLGSRTTCRKRTLQWHRSLEWSSFSFSFTLFLCFLFFLLIFFLFLVCNTLSLPLVLVVVVFAVVVLVLAASSPPMVTTLGSYLGECHTPWPCLWPPHLLHAPHWLHSLHSQCRPNNCKMLAKMSVGWNLA